MPAVQERLHTFTAREPRLTGSILRRHLITIVMLGLSLPAGITYGPTAAVIGLAVAALSFLISRGVKREIDRVCDLASQLDEQLIQSQKLASIGELSAGVAHEINNPLAIIAQEAEWMQHLLKVDAFRDFTETSELNDSLGAIVQQVERSREITHKLLNFARKVEPVLQGANINGLVEDMARLVEKEATLANITIIRRYQDSLPLLNTDPPRVRQVVLNLLTNAIQAIHQKGTIMITTRQTSGDSVQIVIEDSGVGIPKENLHKVFDPFFTTKPPGKGTGLGLSICHGIVEKLGGRISVSSEVGKGTTFTVSLPLDQERGIRK